MKGQWLKNHITGLMALGAVLSCTAIQLIVLLKETKSDPQTTGTILQGSLGIEMLVLSYYFGASKSKTDSNQDNNQQQQ
jgi:hypothetical protein